MPEFIEHAPPVQEINFDFEENTTYNPRCLCDNTGCPRHGNCRLCNEFHKITNHPPTCRYSWKWKKGQEWVRTVKRYSDSQK